MTSCKKIICTIALLFICNDLLTQRDLYYVQHFDTDNGLPQNSIKGIRMDKNGYIWMINETGLVRYDGASFKTIYAGASAQQSGRPLSLHLLADSTIVYKAEDGTFYRPGKKMELEQFPGGGPVVADRARDVMPVMGRLMQRCKDSIRLAHWPRWTNPSMSLFLQSGLTSLAVLGRHYLYFNEDRELILLDTSLTKYAKATLSENFVLYRRRMMDHDAAAAIFQDQNGVYIRLGELIFGLSGDASSGALLAETLLTISDIPDVTAFQYWKELNLYAIGTMTEGLYLYRKKQFTTLTYPNPSLNIFYAQAVFDDSTILTRRGLIPGRRSTMLTGYRSELIYKSKEGYYYLNRWIDFDSAGLVKLDGALRELAFYPFPDLKATAIAELPGKAMLVAAKDHFVGKLTGNRFEWLNVDTSLKSCQVYSMLVDDKNKVFAGSSIGLFIIDPDTHRVDTVRGLQGKCVRTLYLDKLGVLWIGTYGSGYFALYKGVLTKMPIDRNGFLTNVHAFAFDRRGYCWMTTNQGLFQVRRYDLHRYLQRPTDVYFHYYDRTDGFLTNEFNGGCSPSWVVFPNGMISFPSINGIVQFHPSAVNPDLSVKDIFVDRVMADSIVMEDVDRLDLQQKPVMLTFTISSPYYGLAANNTIRYRLNRTDTTWRILPLNGQVSFGRLPAGSYELILSKQAGFGNTVITKRVGFVIHPAFAETILFRVVVAFLVSLLILAIFRARVIYLVRQRDKLESEVRERTTELQQLIQDLRITVDELETSNDERVKQTILQEQLAMMITHDLQSPLRFLSDLTKRLYNKSKENGDMTMIEMSRDIRLSSDSVYLFVRQFGLWLNAFLSDPRLQYTRVHLQDVLDEVKMLLTAQLKGRQNTLEIVCDPAILVESDHQLIEIIIRNLVDNANRFSDGGQIRISVFEVKEQISILVQDDGSGIEKEKLQQLRLLLADPYSSYFKPGKGKGYGFRFISVFCHLLSIEMEIDSSASEGTRIWLRGLRKAK